MSTRLVLVECFFLAASEMTGRTAAPANAATTQSRTPMRLRGRLPDCRRVSAMTVREAFLAPSPPVIGRSSTVLSQIGLNRHDGGAAGVYGDMGEGTGARALVVD